MIYANYSKKTGKLLGYYDDDIHSKIPEPNIEITEEQHQEAVAINANFVEDGKLVYRKPVLDGETLKKNRNARREAIFSRVVARITAVSMDREDLDTPEAIQAQKQVYDNFYAAALAGKFGTKKQNEAVIAAHEAAEEYAINLTKMAHAANKAIGALIEAGDDRADAALDYVESLNLTRAELTPEKLAEIKQALGL